MLSLRSRTSKPVVPWKAAECTSVRAFLQVLQRGGERVWPSGQLVGAEVELEQVVQVGRQVGRQAGLHQDVPRQVELLETGLAGEQGGGQGGQVVLREDLVAGGVLLQAAVDAQ